MGKKTKLIMVDCISQFRMRYCVEVPADAPDEWALDTVTCNEAKEFSQEWVGENIISHRVITEEEFFKMCDADNSYLSTWTDEAKKNAFITPWTEEEKAE